MLPLVLALLSAQPAAPAPAASSGAGVVILVVRHQGLSPIEASAMADRFGRALAEAKVPLTMSADEAMARLRKRNPQACRNKPACLAELGRGVGAAAVATLDAGKIFEDLPVRVQLVDARDGSVLLDRSSTVAVEQLSSLDPFFRKVAQDATGALAAHPAFAAPPAVAVPTEKKPPAVEKTPPGPDGKVATSSPTDAPRVTPGPDLTPKSREPGPLATAAPPALDARHVTGGGAVVAGAAAVTFLALGLVQVARLQANDTNPAELRGSPLTYTEAKAAVSAANTDFTVAGICGGVAAALGVVTFVLPGPPPAK